MLRAQEKEEKEAEEAERSGTVTPPSSSRSAGRGVKARNRSGSQSPKSQSPRPKRAILKERKKSSSLSPGADRRVKFGGQQREYRYHPEDPRPIQEMSPRDVPLAPGDGHRGRQDRGGRNTRAQTPPPDRRTTSHQPPGKWKGQRRKGSGKGKKGKAWRFATTNNWNRGRWKGQPPKGKSKGKHPQKGRGKHRFLGQKGKKNW